MVFIMVILGFQMKGHKGHKGPWLGLYCTLWRLGAFHPRSQAMIGWARAPAQHISSTKFFGAALHTQTLRLEAFPLEGGAPNTTINDSSK